MFQNLTQIKVEVSHQNDIWVKKDMILSETRNVSFKHGVSHATWLLFEWVFEIVSKFIKVRVRGGSFF